MTKINTPGPDWEVSEDYYQTDEEKKEMRLEDFMDPDTDTPSDSFGKTASSESTEALQQTINDVRQVMALASQGRTIDQIAQDLGLDRQYVYDIQVTAQGFHEDDEVAVAHLLMMN